MPNHLSPWVIFRRFLHLIFGHKFHGSKKIEKQIFKNHPNSDEENVFSVTVRVCVCGLDFLDAGMEFTELGRKKWYPPGDNGETSKYD